MNETKEILEQVADGRLSVDEAMLKLKTEPFVDVGYAKVDLHRAIRQGQGEVIYGESKTAEEIRGILEVMRSHGQERVLITRLSSDKAHRGYQRSPGRRGGGADGCILRK